MNRNLAVHTALAFIGLFSPLLVMDAVAETPLAPSSFAPTHFSGMSADITAILNRWEPVAVAAGAESRLWA
jgi:hypothetical protein